MTEPNHLPYTLLSALETFDQTTAPLGLYACEEYNAKAEPFPRLQQEWNLCVKPYLESCGYDADSPRKRELRDGEFLVKLPNGSNGQIKIVRTCKIKVRKFGSAYRIDPHHDYSTRWNELRMDRTLSKLWKLSAIDHVWDSYHLVIIVGFAPEAEPFAKELNRLEEQLQWEEHRVDYQTRFWQDRYQRHFSVRLGVWTQSVVRQDAEAGQENLSMAD